MTASITAQKGREEKRTLGREGFVRVHPIFQGQKHRIRPKIKKQLTKKMAGFLMFCPLKDNGSTGNEDQPALSTKETTMK